MRSFATPRAWTAKAVPPISFRIGSRIENEFYPTPPEATRALLSVEAFDGPIWEPACGKGAIAQVLTDRGHALVSTDFYAYGFGVSGVDFLRQCEPRAKHIVTNPPYGKGLADGFLRRALALTAKTGGKVAMLLNLQSLCHPIRTADWQRRPPARIYAVDDIVCWPEDGYGAPPPYFRKHRYVWAVWTPGHTGPSSFWWLSGADFRQKMDCREAKQTFEGDSASNLPASAPTFLPAARKPNAGGSRVLPVSRASPARLC